MGSYGFRTSLGLLITKVNLVKIKVNSKLSGMEITAKLNLTRKWRSKTFDAIIGQDVSVRILKNSLFLDQIFPVYLFSGQRGCGKTSTARVFTAALNCEELPAFRQNPRLQAVPCLSCAACLAMADGKHPDFTEIDAASHTGVDSVRQLIETTYYLPLMGRKKVYLIDEVHMLSKAAFNALLKVLEEPPKDVVFILATTDPHKVIETVKSRCFQLFFGPPKPDELLSHLQQICVQEKIQADADALAILVRESEGSVRDAMNLLDQIRFVESHVTAETVAGVLGYLDDGRLLQLLLLVLEGSAELPAFLQHIDLASKNVDFVWRRFCELLKLLIYVKHGVGSKVEKELQVKIKDLVHKFDLRQMVDLLDRLMSQEQVLLKTARKSLALELFFLQGIGRDNLSEKVFSSSSSESLLESKDFTEPSIIKVEESVVKVVEQSVPELDAWQQLLGLLSQCGDPVLVSIFKQAKFTEVQANGCVRIGFAEENLFFAELIKETMQIWQPCLRQVFGDQATLKPFFSAELQPASLAKPASQSEGVADVKAPRVAVGKNFTPRSSLGQSVDVSDKNKWPLANSILESFPGQIYEVIE